jgi:hypothetical protein
MFLSYVFSLSRPTAKSIDCRMQNPSKSRLISFAAKMIAKMTREQESKKAKEQECPKFNPIISKSTTSVVLENLN